MMRASGAGRQARRGIIAAWLLMVGACGGLGEPRLTSPSGHDGGPGATDAAMMDVDARADRLVGGEAGDPPSADALLADTPGPAPDAGLAPGGDAGAGTDALANADARAPGDVAPAADRVGLDTALPNPDASEPADGPMAANDGFLLPDSQPPPDGPGPALVGAIFVSPTGRDDADGQSPATARRSIAAGLAAVAAGGTLALASGRYHECLTIRAAVKIYGGYDPTFTTRDLGNRAVIDATGLDCRGITVSIESPPLTFALSGVGVEGGVAKTSGGDGGGIAVYRASEVTLEDCAILSNTGRNGGGLFLERGRTTVDRCVISNNRATNSGGGVALYGGATLIATEVRVEDNRAAGTSGGGVAAGERTTVSFTRVVVAGNGCNGYGGGVDTWEATASFDQCTFANNAATRSGGGLSFGPSARGPSYVVKNGTFQGNGPNAIAGPFTDGGGNVFR